MPVKRTVLIWTLSAVIAVAAVVTAGAAWALASSHGAGAGEGQAGPGSDATPGSVPALYTGDELSWLLLPDDRLTSLFGGTDAQPVEAFYGTMGESEGRNTTPAGCLLLEMPPSEGIIGARRVKWTQGTDTGWMNAMQFASAAQAEDWAVQTTDLLGPCATYTLNDGGSTYGGATISRVTKAEGDDTQAVVYDKSITADDKYTFGTLVSVLRHGNLVMTLTVPYRGTLDVDRKALADELVAQAVSAHRKLVDELQ